MEKWGKAALGIRHRKDQDKYSVALTVEKQTNGISQMTNFQNTPHSLRPKRKLREYLKYI